MVRSGQSRDWVASAEASAEVIFVKEQKLIHRWRFLLLASADAIHLRDATQNGISLVEQCRMGEGGRERESVVGDL